MMHLATGLQPHVLLKPIRQSLEDELLSTAEMYLGFTNITKVFLMAQTFSFLFTSWLKVSFNINPCLGPTS